MAGVDEPLTGCVIVLTSDRSKNELAASLKRRGATVAHVPAISTLSARDDAQLIDATRRMIAAPPDIVVVTTGTSCHEWLQAVSDVGIGNEVIRILRRATVLARCDQAAFVLRQVGVTADWVSPTESAEELADHLLECEPTGKRVAVLHHGDTSDGFDDALAGVSADVQSLVVDGIGGPSDTPRHLEWLDKVAAGQADAVVFTSAPAASSWVESASEQGVLEVIGRRARDGRLCLSAVGPVSAEPLERAGLHVSYPQRWRVGALVGALVTHFSEHTVGIATPEGPLVMRATCAVLDGRVLALSPTSLEILRVLAGTRGNVVTREDLMDLLPGAQASARTVDTAINRLREQAESRRLVKTVVKRGYALAVAS